MPRKASSVGTGGDEELAVRRGGRGHVVLEGLDDGVFQPSVAPYMDKGFASTYMMLLEDVVDTV